MPSVEKSDVNKLTKHLTPMIGMFIYSGCFRSATSSPLLLRGAPDYNIDTVSELTRQDARGNYH